jgi:hypothetical protein
VVEVTAIVVVVTVMVVFFHCLNLDRIPVCNHIVFYKSFYLLKKKIPHHLNRFVLVNQV